MTYEVHWTWTQRLGHGAILAVVLPLYPVLWLACRVIYGVRIMVWRLRGDPHRESA